jgi:hypothetical protein
MRDPILARLDTLFLHSHSLLSAHIQQESHELEYMGIPPFDFAQDRLLPKNANGSERGSEVGSLSGTVMTRSAALSMELPQFYYSGRRNWRLAAHGR